MTAPSPTSRTEPSVVMLGEGFSSLVTFGLDADIDFKEIEVTPGGYDTPDAIPATTMFNTSRETQDAPALWRRDNGSMLVAYAPSVIDQILAIIGMPTTITQTWPDGSSEADYGYLKSFKPGTLTVGGRATATVEFVYTGKDADGNEEDPFYTAPS